MLDYIIIFFISSLFGWLYEHYIIGKEATSTDLVLLNINMPLLTIYGWGSVLIVLLYKNLYKMPLYNKILITVLIIIIFECLVGQLSYKYNKYHTWIYPENHIISCNGYISVYASIVWLVFVIILYLILDNYVYPTKSNFLVPPS